MRFRLACGLALAVAGAGCSKKRGQRADMDPATVSFGSAARDAGSAPDAGPWPELAKLPTTEPLRVITIAAKPDVPRFTVAGPVLLGDLAIVASSQFGFTAVDFRRGQLVWNKPAGSHIAPPVVADGNALLVGSCLNPPEVPAGEKLLGCLRVVSPAGTDLAFVAIHGKDATAFDASDGEQHVWKGGKGEILWRRGNAAVSIDPLSGVAKATKAEDPPLVISYKDRSWSLRRTEDGIIDAKGTPSWHTERGYGALLGAVRIPGESPFVRVAGVGGHGGTSEILIFDIDATGSLNSQVTLSPVPGISITSHAIDSVGDVALAVRLDTSLSHDYIAGYAANASLIWTYALPQMQRPDPIGIAMAGDAVVVFHDGDTVTVLPELSAPPTAPGAVRAPSENATP